MLMRSVLNAHSKTGLEWLYCDGGKLNLKSVIQVRRLMYLWLVLNRSESELTRKMHHTQTISSSVGDWVRLVQADKSELGITLTDTDIQGVSQNVFKNFVSKRVKMKHLRNMASLKQKHSKAKFLNCTAVKQAEYIRNPNFSTREKQLLFKLRSKTLDVKQNFGAPQNNPWCTSCGLFTETQSHLLQCPELTKNLGYIQSKASKINENFVYGSALQQEIIVKFIVTYWKPGKV